MIRALWLLALIGCGGTSELVVVVDTDLSVPDELAMIRAVVEDQTGRPRSLNDFVLDESNAPALPFSFGVVPIDGDSDRTIEIELGAHDGVGTQLFVMRARTGFAANKTLRLPMFLASSCQTNACSAEETCTADGCASPEVSIETLAEIEPGEEI